MRDYYRDAGNKGPAVGSLAALMNCVPGFNTAQLKEFLLKLQIPAVEEVADRGAWTYNVRRSGGELSWYIGDVLETCILEVVWVSAT